MFSNVPSSEGPGQMEISFERISMIILVGRDDWELFAEKPAVFFHFEGSINN